MSDCRRNSIQPRFTFRAQSPETCHSTLSQEIEADSEPNEKSEPFELLGDFRLKGAPPRQSPAFPILMPFWANHPLTGQRECYCVGWLASVTNFKSHTPVWKWCKVERFLSFLIPRCKKIGLKRIISVKWFAFFRARHKITLFISSFP